MAYFAKESSSSPAMRLGGIALILAYLGVGAVFLWRVLPLVKGRESVPLHYTVSLGIDSVGPWWMLGVLPGIILLFSALNGLILRKFFMRRNVFSDVTGVVCMLFSVLLLLAGLHLALMNIAYG